MEFKECSEGLDCNYKLDCKYFHPSYEFVTFLKIFDRNISIKKEHIKKYLSKFDSKLIKPAKDDLINDIEMIDIIIENDDLVYAEELYCLKEGTCKNPRMRFQLNPFLQDYFTNSQLLVKDVVQIISEYCVNTKPTTLDLPNIQCPEYVCPICSKTDLYQLLDYAFKSDNSDCRCCSVSDENFRCRVCNETFINCYGKTIVMLFNKEEEACEFFPSNNYCLMHEECLLYDGYTLHNSTLCEKKVCTACTINKTYQLSFIGNEYDIFYPFRPTSHEVSTFCYMNCHNESLLAKGTILGDNLKSSSMTAMQILQQTNLSEVTKHFKQKDKSKCAICNEKFTETDRIIFHDGLVIHCGNRINKLHCGELFGYSKCCENRDCYFFRHF